MCVFNIPSPQTVRRMEPSDSTTRSGSPPGTEAVVSNPSSGVPTRSWITFWPWILTAKTHSSPTITAGSWTPGTSSSTCAISKFCPSSERIKQIGPGWRGVPSTRIPLTATRPISPSGSRNTSGSMKPWNTAPLTEIGPRSVNSPSAKVAWCNTWSDAFIAQMFTTPSIMSPSPTDQPTPSICWSVIWSATRRPIHNS